MILKLALPSLVQLHEDVSLYISDIVGLETMYDETERIQLLPDMEVKSLKVHLRTITMV